MGRSEVAKAEQILKEAGFAFSREATHGAFWLHPRGERILLPRQFGTVRAFYNFKADVKRALRKMGLEADTGAHEAPPEPEEEEDVATPFDKPTVIVKKKSNIPDAVLNVITSQDLTEKQKVGMLLGFGEFPPPVLNILGAPELNTNQKVSVNALQSLERNELQIRVEAHRELGRVTRCGDEDDGSPD